MRTIRTSIDVDAPGSVVWDVLSDVSSYAEWNPHVTSVDGELEQDETLRITVRREGAKARSVTVRVTDLDAGRRIEWVGTVLSPWLFEGRHAFELEPLDGDRTRLHNREEVSGILAPFVLTEDPERDYEAMNRALKERAESIAVADPD